MSKITPADLAKALEPVFPAASPWMVRCWCEEGAILSCRNPLKKNPHYVLYPHSVLQFLSRDLELTDDQIETVGRRLRIRWDEVMREVVP